MRGSIIARGENVWLVRAFIGRNPDGSRKSHSHTIHGRKEDAEKYLTGFLRDFDMGQYAEDKRTVNELLDGLLENYRRTGKRTLKEAERIIEKNLRPGFGTLTAHKLTDADVARYRKLRRKPTSGKGRAYPAASESTIERSLAILRRALAIGGVDVRIKRESVDNVRQGFFDRATLDRVCEHLPAYLQPVALTAFLTGMRKGEILRLRWEQVDLARGVIRLEGTDTKNKEPRIVPLLPELRQTLATLPRFDGSSWVFTQAGAPIGSINKAWNRACAKAGIDLLIHDLRRSAVRNLIRAGVPESIAMRMSGHKTNSTFKRYGIVDEQDLIDAARKLDSYLNASLP